MSTGRINQLKKLKINRFKLRTRAFLAIFLLAAVSYGVLYYFEPTIAGVTNKPNVLIWNFRGLNRGTVTSATSMSNALSSIANVTITDNTPTLADANTYDAVILTAGNYLFDSNTDFTAAEFSFLEQYLNSTGNKGHLIIEGEQILDDHIGNSYSGKSVNADLLKVSSFVATAASANSRIQITNTTHPVTTGLSTSWFGYTARNFRAFTTTSGTRLAQWERNTTQDTVLSVWEGASKKRLVFIDFYLNDWGHTNKNALVQNAVRWVSDFVEVELANIASGSYNPGATNVKMARLKLSSYANASNTNINTITGFSVYQTGTAALSSISEVKLYKSNVAGDLIGSPVATTVFSGGKATFHDFKLPINTNDNYYVLTYDIASPADEGKTLKLKLGNVSQFTTLEGSPVKLNGGDETGTVTINNITAPSIPTQVYATNLATGNSLKVWWHANPEWDVAGYRVYQAVDSGSGVGSYSLRGTSATNTYTDTGLTEFYRYYYKVTAYDIAGNSSGYSAYTYAVPNRPPATPTGLSVTNPGAGHKLNLAWNAVTGEPNDPFNGNKPDLAGYNLYAATSLDGTYGKVNATPITGTSYTHTGIRDGITYYYKIDSVDRYGLESPLSAQVSAVSTDSTPPEIVSVYPTEGQDYVEPNVTVKVKFDELLDISGGISTWLKLERKNLDNTYTNLSGTISFDSRTYELSFNPDSDLSTVGTFRVTVKGGAGGVRSFATAPNLVADKIWTFGTLLNPHADFETNSTLCGYCHSAHSATGQQIIKQPKILDLCFMCHDGTGSAYDVKAGKYFNGERAVPLAAGGYDLALGSTSTHFTDLDSPVYGSPGYTMTIDCNTCHEPHRTDNYRNIRTSINGKPISITAVVYGPAYSLNTVSGYEITSYVSGWEQFCGACHEEYQTYHSVTTITGEEEWRHRTGVPLTGGSTDGRWVVSFPGQGLYTTLPTLGSPTGANITNSEIISGGSLGTGTYNYIVTAKNAVGESVYGNILQIPGVPANSKIKIQWERIENAYKYRIYRYKGSGDPNTLDVTQFRLVAEVPDYPVEFTDNITAVQTDSPPLTSNAKLTCITCHYVHGTPAVADNGEPTRLRRYDNDGICQDCHKK